MASVNCTEFLGQFVLPLVAGGEMHVGAPVDEPTLGKFESDLPEASVSVLAIDNARERVLSQLVVNPPIMLFDVDELRLAAAVHNLLFLSHPDAKSWGMSQATRKKVIETARKFAIQPRPTERGRVMARHALLHNVHAMTRIDTRVSWWTGSETFIGQPVSKRLLRWAGIRRVHEEKTDVGFRELFLGPDVAAVVSALFRCSPLTQLMLHSTLAPHLHWQDTVFVLRDPGLARAVAYRALRGADPEAVVRGPARFAASFEQMLELSPREEDVRTVAAFLVYLNGLLALGESKMTGESTLVDTVLGAVRRARGVATFFALPAAIALVDSRLAIPPGVTQSTPLAARWEMHRQQTHYLLGAEAIDELAERVRRHLTMIESKTA